MNKPKLVFSDFDGTMTSRGELLTPEFFKILDLLKQNKIPFHIISGRSISWGHFLLTHFDLDSCTMEGGGVILTKDENGFIKENYMVNEAILNQLESFSESLLARFSGLKLTVDSLGRRSDRAIELFDLKNDKKKFEEIQSFMREEGIHFSASNVHLNFWCGEISKAKAALYFLKKYEKNLKTEDCLFFGDALNDQSMFKEFSHSVGVSNIKSILDRFEHKPSIILEGEENYGPFGVFNYLNSLLGT